MQTIEQNKRGKKPQNINWPENEIFTVLQLKAKTNLSLASIYLKVNRAVKDGILEKIVSNEGTGKIGRPNDSYKKIGKAI